MSEQARIFQINVSRGGVPKQAVASAAVEAGGIVGDKQRDRRYHGGPTRALCLYSFEQIARLESVRHPFAPGTTGENITTIGFDLSSAAPGDRLALGEDVVIEIMSYTSPCKTIRASFIDGEFNRISQKVHPGWSRLYASVLSEGTISTGDPIRWLDRDATT